MTNRATIFVHYDKNDIVDNYVYYYLDELKQNSSKVIFVSTSNLKNDDITRLSKICCDVIIRENTGYDFMSYRIGLNSFDYTKYDEVVICNDSVYGPFYPLSNIFKEMEDKNCNFWGITSSAEIAFHLQSYFLVFKKPVLLSLTFFEFWEDVKTLDDKRKIIETYEVGLTQKLISKGFLASTFISYNAPFIKKILLKIKRLTLKKIIDKISSSSKKINLTREFTMINYTHSFWRELILVSKMPFIKIELLRDNPVEVNISDYKEVINKISGDYDISLIEKHLDRVYE